MNVRRSRFVAVAVPLAAAAALLAGCGSDSGPVSAPASSPATSSTSAVAPSSETSAAESEEYPSTSTPPSLPPPYIDYTEWVQTAVGPSLQIHPTQAGRTVTGDGTQDEAWSEVLKLSPNADTPGMRAQFDCHWTFARLVDPNKPSWNLEPGRPVVSQSEMIATRCNPGFAEE
ncbi:DUF2599 domain-containing protein [Gordonia sp. PP30]|uniref:DUF2599 domain-containing protein n=1 Tax=unclassified Gordonia (in: high G+C Gram-positive bacteria) TaxID=2657482 RepID=UPI0032D582B4